MALGPHVRHAALEGAHIADVPATVMALLGCPLPDNFDGRVLTEMLTDDVQVPGRTGAAEGGAMAAGLAGGDRVAVEERLKRLGYM